MGTETLDPKTKTGRDPKLDRDTRREAIIDVARDMFLSVGYSDTSMSAIASRLGGSKGTLYNYFKSKEELFSAYVTRHCEQHRKEMCALLAEDGPVKQVMRQWAMRYVAIVTSDFSLRNFRMITSVSQKWPDIGRIFYESGPKRGVEVLADFLSQAEARGELRMKDATMAAHQFIGLCQNRFTKARFCNYIAEPSASEIATEVDEALEVFFKAYGV